MLIAELDWEKQVFHKDQVKLLAPVPRPGKAICVGLNYKDHALESNLPIPSR